MSLQNMRGGVEGEALRNKTQPWLRPTGGVEGEALRNKTQPWLRPTGGVEGEALRNKTSTQPWLRQKIIMRSMPKML